MLPDQNKDAYKTGHTIVRVNPEFSEPLPRTLIRSMGSLICDLMPTNSGIFLVCYDLASLQPHHRFCQIMNQITLSAGDPSAGYAQPTWCRRLLLLVLKTRSKNEELIP